MSSLTDRIVGAAQLRRRTYEEVEHDRHATGQAMVVVLVSSVGAGVGAIGIRGAGFDSIIAGSVAALGGWVIWAFLVMFIGTRLVPEERTHADVGQLLRTTGFAQAPGVLRAGGILPLLGPLIYGLVSVWMLVCMVVAVRQALDFSSTTRAVLVCAIGWVTSIIAAFLLLAMFGPVAG